VAAVIVAAISFAIPSAPTHAVVRGGIQPCAALPVPGLPGYSAGTAYVLQKGRVVASEKVGTDEMYTFVLGPGDYRLEATYPESNALSRTDFSVSAGDDIVLDAPNECI
jgi:hypothetical protein